MKLKDFIDATRQLIKQQVFMGRSQRLEDSLSVITDALEQGETRVPQNQISAQVTAGWWANASGAKVGAAGGEENMSLSEAWSFLYREIGNLQDIYIEVFRGNLINEFSQHEYSKEIKALWLSVFTEEKARDPQSRYANLEQFIDEFQKPAPRVELAAASIFPRQKLEVKPPYHLKDQRFKKCRVSEVQVIGEQQYKIVGTNHRGESRDCTLDFKNQQLIAHTGETFPFDKIGFGRSSAYGPMTVVIFSEIEDILRHFDLSSPYSGLAAYPAAPNS